LVLSPPSQSWSDKFDLTATKCLVQMYKYKYLLTLLRPKGRTTW